MQCHRLIRDLNLLYYHFIKKSFYYLKRKSINKFSRGQDFRSQKSKSLTSAALYPLVHEQRSLHLPRFTLVPSLPLSHTFSEKAEIKLSLMWSGWYPLGKSFNPTFLILRDYFDLEINEMYLYTCSSHEIMSWVYPESSSVSSIWKWLYRPGYTLARGSICSVM